jgi:hypothetical protein
VGFVTAKSPALIVISDSLDFFSSCTKPMVEYLRQTTIRQRYRRGGTVANRIRVNSWNWSSRTSLVSINDSYTYLNQNAMTSAVPKTKRTAPYNAFKLDCFMPSKVLQICYKTARVLLSQNLKTQVNSSVFRLLYTIRSIKNLLKNSTGNFKLIPPNPIGLCHLCWV